MRNIIVSSFCFLIWGCSTQSMDDETKRNENWVWFIDKDSGSGHWVPIGKQMTVPDGSYTAFYHRGKIRETGKIVSKQYTDTIFYYSLDGMLDKYIIIKRDTSLVFYYNNGYYKGYSPTEDLLVEGTVNNHMLEDMHWFGTFGYVTTVLQAVQPQREEWKRFVKQLRIILQNANNSNDSMNPKLMLLRLDTSFNRLKTETGLSVIRLEKIEDNKEVPQLKEDEKSQMFLLQKFESNELNEMVKILREGPSEKNRTKLKQIIIEVGSQTETEKNLTREYMNYFNHHPPDREQLLFLRQHFPETFHD